MNLTKMYVMCLSIVLLLLAMPAFVNAIPVLQLGPGDNDPAWHYDNTSETWALDGLSGTLNAYALENRKETKAWNSEGLEDRYAYLIAAAMPKKSGKNAGDQFNLTVSSNLTLQDYGYGVPPAEDPNSIGRHGIYPSYYEIYQFQFEQQYAVANTEPGEDDGTKDGWMESFLISVDSMESGVTGVHFDLFTISGDGTYDTAAGKKFVNSVAPFSHDAEFRSVPSPGSVALLGLAMITLYFIRQHRLAIKIK